MIRYTRQVRKRLFKTEPESSASWSVYNYLPLHIAYSYSTGKLGRFLVEPGHLEKQAETFRTCLGGISD